MPLLFGTTTVYIRKFTGLYFAWGGQRKAFTPLCQNLTPLGTCEHCVKCGNKACDAPQNFLTINFHPLLTIFLNEPLNLHLHALQFSTEAAY